jgi:hypothetical protein
MDLWELKEKIDESQKGQGDAAKAVVAELDKLDIPHYHYQPNNDFFLRKAGDKKEFLQIYSSSCGLSINVVWWVGCYEADCEERDCDGEHRKSRPATADEVIFVLDNYLRKKLREIQNETARLRKIATSITEMSRE